ncbi:MAG TPA: hypothetical protein VF177_12780, partial [Anaerolineae bacterium]
GSGQWAVSSGQLGVDSKRSAAKDAGLLYVSDDERRLPWAAVARELALAIKGGGAVGGLAIGIKEVLAAETFAEAAQVLDELGYA